MPKTERLANKFRRFGFEPILIFEYKYEIFDETLNII